jgi:membrane-bound serine protease (ClpP class)
MDYWSGQGAWIVQDIYYILLVAAIWTSVLAIASPGTGMLEIVAGICIFFSILAAILTPVNLWALGILVLGLTAFLIEVARPMKGIFLVVSIVLFSVGSAFLYPGSNGQVVGVSWLLAVVASLCTAVFFWFIVRKVLETRKRPPQHNPSAVVDQVGDALTDISSTGSVQMTNEIWSACSETRIPKGSRVRVLSRRGLVLTVRKES